MKKKIILNSLAIFLGFASFAQSKESSTLWEIKGQGIKKSYVFGTVHMLPANEFVLKDKVVKALKSSDKLVMELDLDDPMLQMQYLKNAQMPEGVTINDFLTEAERTELSDYLERELSVNLDAVKNMKPFLLSSMIVPKLMEGEMASFERSLMAIATEGKKEILGLETVVEQMSVFDSIPYKKQVLDVLKMIRDTAESKSMFRDMIKDYQDQDIESLFETTSQYMESEEEMYFLLEKRNNLWVDRVKTLAGKNKCFFAVGAAHLAGEQGFLKLLEKAGYTVSAVTD